MVYAALFLLVGLFPALALANGEFARPESIRVGLLFPLLKRSFVKDFGGATRLLYALTAIRDINNKTDGRYDDLLPHTRIEFSFRDSKRDAGEATLQAMNLVQKDGVQFVIGPASSSPAMAVHSILKTFHVPQMGYSSTSKALSEDSVYPYFARTAPTDTVLAKGIVRFLSKELGWNYVSILHGDDSYAKSGAEDVADEARAQNMSLIVKEEFVSGSKDLDAHMARVKNGGCRVVVLFSQHHDSETVLSIATKFGMTGTDGYTWIFVRQNPVPVDKRTTALMKGSFSFLTSNGKGTPLFDETFRRVSSFGDVTCSNETDDLGKYIWHQSESDPGTKSTLSNQDRCTGINPASLTLNSLDMYASFAYDAVLAVASTAHKMIEGTNFVSLNQESDGNDTTCTFRVLPKSYVSEVNAIWKAPGKSVALGGISGDVFLDSIGDRSADGLGVIAYNFADGEDWQEIGRIQSDGSLRNSSNVARSDWEFASLGDTKLHVPLTNDDIFDKPAENKNRLETHVLLIGEAAASISIFTAICYALWTIRHRNALVIKCSQPIFLCLIALGCITSSSASKYNVFMRSILARISQLFLLYKRSSFTDNVCFSFQYSF